MKIKYLKAAIFLVLFLFISCEKADLPTFEEFSKIKPTGWECKISTENFDVKSIPKGAPQPIAIVKYTNPTIECEGLMNQKTNPSLILNVYPANRKSELLEFIKSQRMFSWCIPIYYGESLKYFVLTSPCFINGGMYVCLDDLHKALEKILDKKEYTFD